MRYVSVCCCIQNTILGVYYISLSTYVYTYIYIHNYIIYIYIYILMYVCVCARDIIREKEKLYDVYELGIQPSNYWLRQPLTFGQDTEDRSRPCDTFDVPLDQWRGPSE